MHSLLYFTNVIEFIFVVDSLIRVSEALDILLKHKRIDAELSNEVMRFLKANPANIPFTKAEDHQRTSQINKVNDLNPNPIL